MVSPAQRQRRNLVAQGLACAGGHDGEDVLAIQQGFDGLRLAWAEGVEAEDILEDAGGIGGRWFFGECGHGWILC